MSILLNTIKRDHQGAGRRALGTFNKGAESTANTTAVEDGGL
nr:hypothetical protein [Luminiphilus sp.]